MCNLFSQSITSSTNSEFSSEETTASTSSDLDATSKFFVIFVYRKFLIELNELLCSILRNSTVIWLSWNYNQKFKGILRSPDWSAAFPTRILIKILEKFQIHLIRLPHSIIKISFSYCQNKIHNPSNILLLTGIII